MFRNPILKAGHPFMFRMRLLCVCFLNDNLFSELSFILDLFRVSVGLGTQH